MLGFGAIVSEAIYCAIPLFGLNLLLEDSGVYEVMYLVFIPVMVFLGVYSIVNRNKTVSVEAQKPRKTSNNFLYGLFLCASNPMTLVFWTQTTVYLKQNDWISDDISVLVAFLLGVPTGTFLLYFTFVEIAWRTGKNMGETAKANVNVIIGLIFILLAGYLLYSYLSGSAQGSSDLSLALPQLPPGWGFAG